MTPGRLLLLLAVLAALVLWLGWFSGEPGGATGPEGGGTATQAERPGGDAGAAEAPAGGGAGTRETLPGGGRGPAASGGARVLTGRVLDRERGGIGGAWVIASHEQQVVLSDENGRFQLPLEGAFTEQDPRRLFAWSEGCVVVESLVFPGQSPDLVLLPDQPRPLTIVDAQSGAPVAGASVRALAAAEPGREGLFSGLRRWIELPLPLAHADSAGRLTLSGGVVPTLEIAAQGYATAYEPAGARAATVRLQRAVEKRVRLLRPDGQPLAGAQAAFPRAGVVVQADADGWVSVPSAALPNLWGMQVVWEDFRWVHELGYASPDEVESGTELVLNHFPRAGVLRVGGEPAEGGFEVATSAQSSDDDSFLPDPMRRPEDLLWYPVGPAGAFRASGGWQSETTWLHVRRSGGREVLHSEPLADDGPYEIDVTPTFAATLHFAAKPTALLAGAMAFVSDDGSESPTRGPLPVESGAVVFELEPGEWHVFLQLAGQPWPRRLGNLQMPQRAWDFDFDLGPVRTLSGTVRCGGEPLFPCQVRLVHRLGPRHYRAFTRTDAGGAWSIAGAPLGELLATFQPDDPWLGSGEPSPYGVPSSELVLDVDLPARFLQIIPGELGSLDPARITVDLYQHSAAEREGGTEGWHALARMPDLSRGPVTVKLAPAVVGFRTADPYQYLKTVEVDLRTVDRSSVVLETLPGGLVVLQLEDEEGAFTARVQFGALPGPAANSLARPRPSHRGRAAAPGELTPAWSVPAGDWKVAVTGPFSQQLGPERDRDKGAAVSAVLEIRVEGGKRTTVRITLDEQGAPQLAATDSD